MNIDELFKKTGRLEAPDSLKTKLEAQLDNETLAEGKTSLFVKVVDCFPSTRPIWSLAAIAAMAILAIRFYPGPDISLLDTQTKNLVEARAMLTETLGPVFNYDYDPGVHVVESSDGMEDDAKFLERQVDEIFWINGGDGDA